MFLKSNLFKNGIATALQKLVRVFEQLMLVPFYITAWGAAYYGEWLTLTILPSLLAFSDLGIGSAAANSYVLKYVSGNYQGAADSGKSGKTLVTYCVLGSVVIGAITLFVMNYFHLMDKSLIPKNDAMTAVSLMMLARLIDFYQQLYEGYYRAVRRAPYSINLLTYYALLKVVVSIIILYSGGGIILLSLATLVCAILFNAFYAITAVRLLPVENRLDGTSQKLEMRQIAKTGFGYLLSPIWQAIYFQGTTFVIRIVLGPAAVATFNTVRTVSRSANQIYSLVNGTFFPEIQFEVASEKYDNAKKLFRTSLIIVSALAIAGMLFLALLGPWVYDIWTRGKLKPPTAMWNIFIIGIGFNALWWTAGVVFRAVNKPLNFAFMGVISSLVSIVASYLLSKRFGLTGAAIGNLSLDIIMAFYVLPASCKLINQSFSNLFKDMYMDIKGGTLLKKLKTKTT